MLNYLRTYCEEGGFDSGDESLLEVLRGAHRLERIEISKHRWWNEYRYVVKIEGKLISYVYAEANRDESMSDLGYDFDPSTICEMKEIEKKIKTYEPIPHGTSG